MKFFTLGYQQIHLATFIEALHSQNIGTLLDVRAVPWSRREEFTKRNLAESLTQAGVNYIHLERAGNPAIRVARDDGDVYTDYFEYIERNPTVLDEVFGKIVVSHETNRPACLMCKEANPSDCHRSELSKLLIEKFPELEVTHLMIGAHRDTASGFLPFMESGVLTVLSNKQPLLRI